MTARVRFASSLYSVPALCIFLLGIALPATAKEDWQSDLHKWKEWSQTDPNCKVRYTTGLYRPDLGDKPVWGVMTEKLFKWFSKDGVKLAPSICPASRATQDKAQYRILFSVSPMKTVSHTTHGSEIRTVNAPFSADVTSHTTYSDGGSADSTAAVNGQQTSTVVVPTETTISQSLVAEYMYTYRVNGDQLELIATDSVVFSRVAASGSGDDAASAELGAGIGNLIRASGVRHRADKLCEEALKAIRADAQGTAAKQDALPENHASEGAPADTQQVVTRVAAAVPSAGPVLGQTAANIESAPSAQSIATLKQQAASGDAEAQYNLGNLYAFGPGMPQDYAQAAIWYHKAAEQGRADAQFALGDLYEDGHGVPQDYAQAAVWYRKAADQGYAVAQLDLGVLYEHGSGVPQDYAEAYFWLDLAAAGKVAGQTPEFFAAYREGMRKTRDEAASHLTPADLSRVQERALKWFEVHPAKPQ